MNLLNTKINDGKYPIKISFYILYASWTIIVLGIIGWSYKTIYTETFTLAKGEAYKGFEKDVMFRLWATTHGGVYVPVTKETLPNPYLTNIEERDIYTPSKRELTLMNPAYMTRQIHELSKEQFGILGHITSLTPIRKNNAPDEWEKIALNKFEKGAKEYFGIDTIKNKKYFRYMGALITEKGCLKCHAAQGYKLGEVRGGISSSVPWKHYQDSMISQLIQVIIGYGVLWVIGLISLTIARNRFVLYITKRDIYETELATLNNELLSSNKIIEDNLQQKNGLIDELSETKEKLEKLNSEKDKFFSIIAHDLRSPFMGLLNLSEMMANESENFTMREYAELSKSLNLSAVNVYKLLNNLLDWSMLQRDSIIFILQIQNLHKIVSQNIDTIKEIASQKGVTLENNVDKILDAYVDEKMISTVFRNLISNAVKFTRNGGTVTVNSEVIENQMVQIS